MAYGNQKQIQSPYFATGNPETEEMTTLYAPGMLGCIAQFDQGGMAGPENVCTYQLILQATAIQAVVGNVMYWSDKSTWKVSTARTGNLAGIARIAAAAAATYIWILKKGDRGVLFVAAPTSAPSDAGKIVVASDAEDGKADCLPAANAQAGFPLIGTTLGVTSSNIANCRVNIPDTY